MLTMLWFGPSRRVFNVCSHYIRRVRYCESLVQQFHELSVDSCQTGCLSKEMTWWRKTKRASWQLETRLSAALWSSRARACSRSTYSDIIFRYISSTQCVPLFKDILHPFISSSVPTFLFSELEILCTVSSHPNTLPFVLRYFESWNERTLASTLR